MEVFYADKTFQAWFYSRRDRPDHFPIRQCHLAICFAAVSIEGNRFFNAIWCCDRLLLCSDGHSFDGRRRIGWPCEQARHYGRVGLLHGSHYYAVLLFVGEDPNGSAFYRCLDVTLWYFRHIPASSTGKRSASGGERETDGRKCGNQSSQYPFWSVGAGNRWRDVHPLGHLSDFAFECGVFYFLSHHGNLYPHPAWKTPAWSRCASGRRNGLERKLSVCKDRKTHFLFGGLSGVHL